MTAINEIPNAFALQAQLVSIEAAIAGISTGALVSSVSIIGPPPVHVLLDPPIEIKSLVAALQKQADMLISKLEEMGFAYTGAASSSDVPPPVPLPFFRTPSPPPPLPFTTPVEPPELPGTPLVPPLPSVE
jgi:hypothetical protein